MKDKNFSFINEKKQSLLGSTSSALKRRETAISIQNKIKLTELEIKYNSCNKSCVVFCGKNKYRDFIKNDFEENKQLNSEFSSKSIVVFIFSLFISVLNTTFYRKGSYILITAQNQFASNISSNNSESAYNDVTSSFKINEVLFEYLLFCWRFQSIFIFFIFFIFISNYFVKQNLKEEKGENENKNDTHCNLIHINKLYISKLITINFLKMSFIYSCASFLYLLSTKVLPIGICLIFNNTGLIFNFIIFNQQSKKKLFKFFLFLTISILVFLEFLNEGMDRIIARENKFYFYILGITASSLSSCLMICIYQNYVKELMSSYSPMESALIINLNSVIITSIVVILISLITKFIKNGNIELISHIFGWYFNTDVALVGLGFGLIGLLNIIFMIFSSIYLKSYFLIFFKLFEIPFSDIFGIFVFELYSQPKDYYYYIVVFNFLVTIGIVEFSNLKIKKNPNT